MADGNALTRWADLPISEKLRLIGSISPDVLGERLGVAMVTPYQGDGASTVQSSGAVSDAPRRSPFGAAVDAAGPIAAQASPVQPVDAQPQPTVTPVETTPQGVTHPPDQVSQPHVPGFQVDHNGNVTTGMASSTTSSALDPRVAQQLISEGGQLAETEKSQAASKAKTQGAYADEMAQIQQSYASQVADDAAAMGADVKDAKARVASLSAALESSQRELDAHPLQMLKGFDRTSQAILAMAQGLQNGSNAILGRPMTGNAILSMAIERDLDIQKERIGVKLRQMGATQAQLSEATRRMDALADGRRRQLGAAASMAIAAVGARAKSADVRAAAADQAIAIDKAFLGQRAALSQAGRSRTTSNVQKTPLAALLAKSQPKLTESRKSAEAAADLARGFSKIDEYTKALLNKGSFSAKASEVAGAIIPLYVTEGETLASQKALLAMGIAKGEGSGALSDQERIAAAQALPTAGQGKSSMEIGYTFIVNTMLGKARAQRNIASQIGDQTAVRTIDGVISKLEKTASERIGQIRSGKSPGEYGIAKSISDRAAMAGEVK